MGSTKTVAKIVDKNADKIVAKSADKNQLDLKPATKPETKAELREACRASLRLDTHPEPARLKKSEDLCARLERIFTTRKFSKGIWAAFQPVFSEPDILPGLINIEFGCDIQWAYPRIEGKNIQFYLPNDPAVFTENKWGILEPDASSSQLVDFRQLRGLLIPGLAFDLNLNRLGRGGGFYDRALAAIEKKNENVIKVGVGFDLQVMNTDLPVEEFDIQLDWLVTETRSLGASDRHPKPGRNK